MSPSHYRALFIFDCSEIYRRLVVSSERAIEEQNVQHRVTPHDIVVAWLVEYLVKDIAVVLHPTEHNWASTFFDNQLVNDHVSKHIAHHMFWDALSPATHPCFHHPATLTVTNQDLRLEYIVPYSHVSPTRTRPLP